MRSLRILIAVSLVGTAWFEEEWLLLIPGIWIGVQAFGKQTCTNNSCPPD